PARQVCSASPWRLQTRETHPPPWVSVGLADWESPTPSRWLRVLDSTRAVARLVSTSQPSTSRRHSAFLRRRRLYQEPRSLPSSLDARSKRRWAVRLDRCRT